MSSARAPFVVDIWDKHTGRSIQQWGYRHLASARNREKKTELRFRQAITVMRRVRKHYEFLPPLKASHPS